MGTITMEIEVTYEMTIPCKAPTRSYLCRRMVHTILAIQAAQITLQSLEFLLMLKSMPMQEVYLNIITVTDRDLDVAQILKDTSMPLVKDSILLATLVFPCRGKLPMSQN